DAGGLRRLRYDDDFVLQRPAQEHLSGRLAVTVRDGAHGPVVQLRAAGEGTVSLELDGPLAAELEEPALEQERAELDLVHRRRDVRPSHQLREVRGCIVGD